MVKFSKEAAGSCPCGFFLSIFLVWCGQAQSGHIPEAVEDLERLGFCRSNHMRIDIACGADLGVAKAVDKFTKGTPSAIIKLA